MQEIIKIDMPQDVVEIIQGLCSHGFSAYAVGGCVRDTLLGVEPKDWDITTSASPVEVKEIFGHTLDTGIEHGTVTIMRGKIGYEVTTYRIDGEYSDGRHPDQVKFTPNLFEDLRLMRWPILMRRGWWMSFVEWKTLRKRSFAVWERQRKDFKRMPFGC